MMVADLASEEQFIRYFVLGTLGSVLPDMDADNSAVVRITYSLASVILAFGVMFLSFGLFFSIIELVLIWLATYLFFRWFIFTLFTRLTTHRGIFHSIPAVLFFAFFAAIISHQVFNFPPFQAWMNGVFVGLGYFLHLVLDELYSINVFGIKTRRSLGTALKFYSKSSPTATLCMYLATVVLFLATPNMTTFAEHALDREIYQQIRQRLLPYGGWFNYRETSFTIKQEERLAKQESPASMTLSQESH